MRGGINPFVESEPHVKDVLEPEIAHTVGLVATEIHEALNYLAIAGKAESMRSRSPIVQL